MKNHSNILSIAIIVLSLSTPCFANPISSLLSLFQKDLTVNVLYKKNKNLIQGSKIYLAEDPNGQKILIGEVKNVSVTDSQMTKVEIRIDKKYKERIYKSTVFVLMSDFFSQNPTASIVAISSTEASDKTLLEYGSSVNGVTFLEYKIATAGEELKKIMDSIKKQNDKVLSQLEQYLDTFNKEAFQEKMNDLINKISNFSAEQKETFKKEVLPSLKKMLDSMMEKLKEQNDTEKSEKLKNQLKKIEDLVDV